MCPRELKNVKLQKEIVASCMANMLLNVDILNIKKNQI